MAAPHVAVEERGSPFEVFLVALRLGLTSFGGPVAHLGYFHAEYVVRRAWLDERRYADLLALCQFLPGPASSQVGIAVGTVRAGYLGGFLAWLGFTLPSAAALIAFALIVGSLDIADAGWLHGLKLAAVAVVAQAVWTMARSLAAGRERATIAILATGAALVAPSAVTQVAVIVAGGALGWLLFREEDAAGDQSGAVEVRARGGIAWLVLFAVGLVGLPLLAAAVDRQALSVFDAFYRTGSLVFGGGHVVLPLIEQEVVPSGWLDEDTFIAGYGAAQAVPGPLFTFSAYLGAAFEPAPNGVAGGLLALAAIFLPSFFLVWGALPFWERLRRIPAVRSALVGVGAAVVGILVAALYDPVWTSAVFDARDLALAIAAFGLLVAWRVPPWLVVVLAAAGGELLARF
ncbi:MAG: chromate efflux transporter [Dehalococcoidia bacterium]